MADRVTAIRAVAWGTPYGLRSGRTRIRLLRLARGADAVDREDVGAGQVAQVPGGRVERGEDAQIIPQREGLAPSAPRAGQVVVVAGLETEGVVLRTGLMEFLHIAQLFEEEQRSVDGRAPDAWFLTTHCLLELGGSERVIQGGQGAQDRVAGPGEAVTVARERGLHPCDGFGGTVAARRSAWAGVDPACRAGSR